jgi:hypothetical protein
MNIFLLDGKEFGTSLKLMCHRHSSEYGFNKVSHSCHLSSMYIFHRFQITMRNINIFELFNSTFLHNEKEDMS